MKAITISQPYASLIADGFKVVENRTWETAYRGPIAIHAGSGTQYLTRKEIREQQLPTGAIIAVGWLARCVRVEQLTSHRNSNARNLGVELLAWTEQLQRERIAANQDVDKEQGWFAKDLARHEHTEGPWCWLIDRVKKLPEPFAISGKLGLWNTPAAFEVDWCLERCDWVIAEEVPA